MESVRGLLSAASIRVGASGMGTGRLPRVGIREDVEVKKNGWGKVGL